MEMATEQRDIKKSALVIGDLHANDPRPDVQWATSAIFTEPTARGKATRRHEDRMKLICIVRWTYLPTLWSLITHQRAVSSGILQGPSSTSMQ